MPSSEEHRMKCEVFVFDGPGICRLSKDDLVNSLDTALAFNYWVGTIDHEGLRAEDWTNSCALLVFPHCTEPQSYDALDADLPTIRGIRRFVEGGGSFLGVCGGAYFASRTAEFDGQSRGSANLAFWPWLSRGPHLAGGTQVHKFSLPFLIGQHSTNGLRADNVAPYCNLHYEGGGEFIYEGDNETTPFSLMGRYSTNKYAGVKCTVGAGRAVLWHASLERSFRNGDVERGLQKTDEHTQYDIEKLERYRFRVLRHTLRHLNLQPAPEVIPPPLSPLPQFLVSTSTSLRPSYHLSMDALRNTYKEKIVDPWVQSLKEEGKKTLVGTVQTSSRVAKEYITSAMEREDKRYERELEEKKKRMDPETVQCLALNYGNLVAAEQALELLVSIVEKKQKTMDSQ